MDKIFYLGYYDIPENKKENRNFILAASNKITYICSAIKKTGKSVEIVSASGTKNKNKCVGKYQKIDKDINLKLFFSLGRGTKLKNMLDRYVIQLQLFFYLVKNIRRNQIVLVYHSLGYSRTIKFLKKMLGFKLILEVEEIYADVSGNDKFRKMEQEIIDIADAYIFPTELLDEKLNKSNKPSVVIYGTYQVEEDRKREFVDTSSQSKIHLLYAGTFDSRKGGAAAAITSASALPSDYYIHILGFGSEEDTRKIQEQIKSISEKSEAVITYDGLRSGEEYIRFVQSCQVGFSTQIPDGAFNETSFPSKVLSYLANGLRVVSIRLKVLEKSSIGDLIYFYEEQTPEAIAEVVKSIDFSKPYDSRKRIEKLDREFTKKLKEMLCDLNENKTM